MASSSPFSTCTLNRGFFAIKARNFNEEFKCNVQSLLHRPPIHAKLSADFTDSRLLTGEKLLKSERSQRLLRYGMKCSALELKNMPAFTVGNKFQLDDVIEAQQFDRDTLSAIFEVAREMENIEKKSPGSQILKGYLMATLFYEPSTRTRLSFESAMKRLGGEVLTTENAREFSSAAKGETLEGNFLYLLV